MANPAIVAIKPPSPPVKPPTPLIATAAVVVGVGGGAGRIVRLRESITARVLPPLAIVGCCVLKQRLQAEVQVYKVYSVYAQKVWEASFLETHVAFVWGGIH
jgi:hypothetical protein